MGIDMPITGIRPPTTNPVQTTIGYYAAFILLGMSVAVLGPTLPRLAEQAQTSLGNISFLFSMRALGFILSALFVGRMFDRRAGHPMIAAALLLTATTFIMIPMAKSLWLLLGFLLIIGITESVIDIGANTLLIWLHDRKVGPYMNGLHLFFGIGGFLAPILVAQVLKTSDHIAWAYWSISIGILPIALWLMVLPSPKIRRRIATQSEKSGTSFFVFGMALFFFLVVGTECAFGGWIYTYAMKMNLADESRAAYLTSAFWGAFTLGRLVAIPLAARFKPGALLTVNLLGCLISISLILVLPQAPKALFMGTIGIGGFMASIFPTALSFSEARLNITGRLTGWFFVSGSTGAMLLPWLIGQLIDKRGGQAAMLPILGAIIGALAILASMLIVVKPKETATCIKKALAED
jgi:FHS family Na+ dependent glucose MFS transporter 1